MLKDSKMLNIQVNNLAWVYKFVINAPAEMEQWIDTIEK